MQSDRIDDARHPSVEGRAIFHLRATALRFGAALGWDAAEVASFAAALAGRPWAELDTDDLLRAIEEYWQMSLAVAERRTRLTVRPQSGEQRGLVE